MAEKYKIRMIFEAEELNKNIKRLSKDILKFTHKGNLDPTVLALMNAQHEHMCAYFNTLLLRCEMLFDNDELFKLYNILDKDENGKKDKADGQTNSND